MGMNSIITAIISAAATLIVCLLNNHYQRKRDESKRTQEKEQQQADLKADLTAHLEEVIANQNESTSQIHNEIEMIRYQLSELAKHVDKHNNVIERTYELEKRTELQEEKIKVANHRLNDLEKAVDQ